MRAKIDNKETAIAIFNGLATEYESFTTTLNVFEDGKILFTLDLFKGLLSQKKQ